MKRIVAGIYYIRNLINNRVYIGSSVDIIQRWIDHKKALRHNKHENQYLQNAWNKYGEQNFSFNIIRKVKFGDILTCCEQIYLDLCESYERDKGYNICKYADNHKPSKETVEKIRLASSGKNNSMYGKIPWNKGLTKETDPRMVRISQEQSGENSWMWGRHHSSKTKEVLSKLASGQNNPMWGKHHPQEIIERMRTISKNKHPSQDVKEKIRKANTGKHLSYETKKRMSVTIHKKYWNRISRDWS
jgi:group I intron endonuclease